MKIHPVTPSPRPPPQTSRIIFLQKWNAPDTMVIKYRIKTYSNDLLIAA